ncbi:hypothetical protein DYB30_009006 [Aphanomyces astaci]|uniref:HIT-type domain-containing protein n=1 Tax=Aphanomyces astaci TaxID=112090 RepID=A0A397E644_APHAT|nr:hypothetical protein DYB30_009006 [Aphanomyces astaci]
MVLQPPPTAVSVPIRLGHTKTRVTDTIKLPTIGSVGLSNANPLRVCGVCRENQSKYTCPRCNAVYCGVPCYKKHGISCTEEFYKGHVQSEMRLNKDSSDTSVRDVHAMLQRVHDDFPETSPMDARIDDLVELMESNALTLEALTAEERSNFLREVADGRLGKFIALWEPWWMQSPSSYDTHTNNLRRSLIVDLQDDDSDPTLDDDLTHPLGLFTASMQSALPSLPSLHPNPNHAVLQCNLVEVLFAYAYVMRVYNGDWRVDVEDAASQLVSVSSVLRGDGHFDSVAHVIMACHASGGADANEAAKHVALVDVASILTHGAFVRDSLTDLLLLVQTMRHDVAAAKSTKKVLARVVKKLEFYLVWASNVLTNDLNALSSLQKQLVAQIP